MDDSHQHHHEAMSRCIELCGECHRSCLGAAVSGQADSDHQGLLLDCAEMCQTAADFMSRNSPLHGYACGLCAHVCKVCHDRCAQGDLERIGEICARCADSCMHMSKLAAHETLV